MSSFNTLKQNHKLLLCLLFSLAGLLFFSADIWLKKVATSQQAEQQEALSSLVVHAGAFVHELQKERTLSAGFLASNGAKFGPELAQQNPRTSEQADLLKAWMERAGERLFQGNLPDKTKENFRQTLAKIQDLDRIHREVDANKLTVKEALAYYAATSTSTVVFLVDLVQTEQKQAPQAPISEIPNGLVGWILVFLGILMAGWATLGPQAAGGGGSGDVHLLVQKLLNGEWSPQDAHASARAGGLVGSIHQLAANMGHLPRVVGLHAGNITACASELIKIRDFVRTDADISCTIAKEVARETQQLGTDISAVKQFIEQASANILSISSASQQLSSNITAIAAASEQASGNISTVASAAEEMTANISGVNQSLSQVDQSLQEVALSIQGMTDSLGEVRKRCLAASQESERVNQHALGSRSIMTELSDSAREIGDVVEIINGIAEQTNMLALNASIEAAGAGDAGKGFAVVANEVKELARQTSKATQLIARKAGDIQQKTDGATVANTEIANGIERINQGNAEITMAVDEQAETITGIASAMHAVAEATAEVTRNTQELSLAAHDVAKAAVEVASGTTAIAGSSAEGASGAASMAEDSSRALDFANTILEAANSTEQASGRVQEKMAEATHTATLMHGSAAHFDRLGALLQHMTNALYISQIERETGQPPFNIREMKNQPLLWQGLLEQHLHGRKDRPENPVPEEDACPICLWFSEGREGALGAEESFAEALIHHKELHGIARDVLAALAQSDQAAATEHLLRYHPAREAFFLRLDDLYLGDEIRQQDAQPFFPWNDRLSVGVQVIDDDHKKLVALVNRLHQTMKEGGDAAALGAIIQEAADYTQFHFAREEGLMRQHDYPELARQEAAHRRMVAQLQALAEQFSAGEFSIAMDVMAFAKIWLTQHILGEDMKLKPFFANKSVG